MNIIIYNLSTGEITRQMSVPADLVELQLGPNESYIEHDRVDDTAFNIDTLNEEVVAGGFNAFEMPDGAHALGDDPWTWLKLAANSTVNTTSFVDVPGMSFTAEPNKMYRVELFGAYQTAATTTGIALALDVPANATIIGRVIANTNATSVGGTEQIADATTTGKTTGVRAANTNTPIQYVAHIVIGGVGGAVQLRQASEVATSNTILQAGITAMGYRII